MFSCADESAKPNACIAPLLVPSPILTMFALDALPVRAVVVIMIDLTMLGRIFHRVRVVGRDSPLRKSSFVTCHCGPASRGCQEGEQRLVVTTRSAAPNRRRVLLRRDGHAVWVSVFVNSHVQREIGRQIMFLHPSPKRVRRRRTCVLRGDWNRSSRSCPRAGIVKLRR